MQITLRQLQRLIREQTPDEALGTANDQNNFSPTQKAAMGFVNNVMGPTPAGDQLAGLESQLQSYANLKGIHPDNLRNAVQKMLPPSGQHPQYQYDAASDDVGSTSGKKVYGEHFKIRITKQQLRRIIKEEKAKVLAEQRVRRLVRRRLMEQGGGHLVSGNHEGQEFSVQVPDDLARSLFSAHAALLATSSNPDDVSYADSGSPQAAAFGDAVRQVYDHVDGVVGEQTGKPIGPYGINGEYHLDGSQMSDVLDDAGNFI